MATKEVQTAFTLTSANVVKTSTGYNQLTLLFPQPLTIGKDEEVCLLNGFINYSWPNLTTAYNNLVYQYYWPPNQESYPVTMPNQSFFLVSDVNAYLQQIMVSNGNYLIDNLGNNVYYLNLQTNYTIYGNTLTATPLPASLPDGWSYPSNWVGTLSADNALTPQLVTLVNNFGTLIGFNPNSNYPSSPQTTTQIINSPNVPQLTPVVGCLVNCNLVNSPDQATYGSNIYAFSPNVEYGSTINLQPTQLVWYQAQGGYYPSITLYITDSLLNPLPVLDPNQIWTILKEKL